MALIAFQKPLEVQGHSDYSNAIISLWRLLELWRRPLYRAKSQILGTLSISWFGCVVNVPSSCLYPLSSLHSTRPYGINGLLTFTSISRRSPGLVEDNQYIYIDRFLIPCELFLKAYPKGRCRNVFATDSSLNSERVLLCLLFRFRTQLLAWSVHRVQCASSACICRASTRRLLGWVSFSSVLPASWSGM